jgi:branched-chain amino acid transport system permease protein
VLLDYVMNGLGLGAIYAFIALGYTMVYGIIKLINFAHGEFVMVGAFVGFFVLRDLGVERVALPHPLPTLLSLFVALLAASVAGGVLAVVTERLAYRPVRRAGRIAALLTAVGVSLFLQNLAIRIWGAEGKSYPNLRVSHAVEDLQGTSDAVLMVDDRAVAHDGEVVVTPRSVAAPGDDLAPVRAELEASGHTHVYRTLDVSQSTKQGFVVLALAFWTPLLWFLVKKTRVGKAMRAVSEDADAARLMGVPIDRVVSATFFLGGFLAGVAGVAFGATYLKVTPLSGLLPGLKAFVAAVIGGIGSIPGAILGGLILGLVESVVPFLLERVGWASAFAWKDAIAFALLIAILVLRPRGLLGKAVVEKV